MIRKTKYILLVLSTCLLLNACVKKGGGQATIKENISTAAKTDVIVETIEVVKDEKSVEQIQTPQAGQQEVKAAEAPQSTSNEEVKKAPSSTPQSNNNVITQEKKASTEPVITPPSTVQTDRFVKLGSSISEVIAIMGPPKSQSHSLPIRTYGYGDSTYIDIYDDDKGGRVVGWKNTSGVLKVSTGEKVSSAPPITLGSTMADVTRAMGTPNKISSEYATIPSYRRYWEYRNKTLFSTIIFDPNNKVIGWHYEGVPLKTSLGGKKTSAPPVWLGSTIQDVVNAFGTPMSVGPKSSDLPIPAAFSYDGFSVTFDDSGKVNGWLINEGTPKISKGAVDPSAPPFQIGSSADDVIKAMGTPYWVQQGTTWAYGNSYVFFTQNGKVSSVNNAGNLKVQK
jgi:hypothetical protein